MRSAVVVMLLVLAGIVSAQPGDKLAQIREQQALLATELDSGVLKVTARESALIRKDQARVRSLIEGRTLDDLGVAERVELDNALERINALVMATRQADEARDVCRYERPTGSKLRKLECMTAAARGNHRDGARAYLDRPRVCVPPGCGQ